MTESIETTEADAQPWEPPTAPAATAMAPLPVTAATIEGARKLLARLCNSGRVRMTVPPRDDDEDMILLAIIELAALTIAEPAANVRTAPVQQAPDAAADVRDAERYRWLRVQHWYAAKLCVVTDPKRTVRLGTDCPSDARLDELIDAERGAAPVQLEADAAPAANAPPLKGLAHFHYLLEAASGYEQEGVYNNITADGFGRVIAALEGARDDGRAAPQPTQGAPATCRLEDGRCGICGGNWSVCGCDGMLRRAARPGAEAGKP